MIPRHPRSTFFPYTTLFRSSLSRSSVRETLFRADILPHAGFLGELAADSWPEPARAEILHFLRGRLLPQAEAQLHLDVPDPAARLGAENLDTRPAGREYQPHAGTLPAGDLADRAAGADTGRCRPCLRRALLHMAGLGFPPHASGFGGNRRRRGPCLGDHAVNRRRHTLSRETADAAGAVRSGVARQRR